MIKPTRIWILVGSVALTIATVSGCHGSYEERVVKRIDRIKYQKKIDANLGAPVGAPLQPLDVYLRPPNGLSSAGNVLNIVEGLFDANFTLAGSGGERLHVFARRKAAPGAAKKDAPPPAPGVSLRKDILEDVLALLPAAQAARPKTDEYVKNGNKFTRRVYTLGDSGQVIEIYSYATPNREDEVVIAVERPQNSTLTQKFDMMFETLAFGQAAVREFGGGATPGPEAAPPPDPAAPAAVPGA